MTTPQYGSDLVVDLMRAAGIEYVAFNPGATFRGLHDSLVNYGGNRAPEIILCTHEEIAVSVAHGYAKAAGRPMATVAHNIVGLQHASMAIFNAFCDRAPILVLGGTGPMDTSKRRPWIDWIHTALVQGTLVRDYVKFDDQPASIAAVPEAFVRAWRIARTEPLGPVYVCLDATVQEERLERAIPLPDLARFEPPAPPQADPRALEDAARRLCEARSPVILVGSLGGKPAASRSLLRLADLLAAPVVDLSDAHQGRPSVPSTYALDMSAARQDVVADADVVLALDVPNLLGALADVDRATRQVQLLNDRTKVITISLDDYAHRSWAQTYLSLVPVDLPIAAHPAVALPALVALVEDRLKNDPEAGARRSRAERIAARRTALAAEWRKTLERQRSERPIAQAVLAAEVWEAIKTDDWILANGTANGWARRLWEWRPERSYGGSGGAGLGYGLGASIGVALAHRDSGRLCIDLQSDGDLLYVLGGLHTLTHHRLPLLIVMCNNRSYYNDEEHQERMALVRGRPVENKGIGIRIDDPAPDFAKIAQGFGIYAEGPVEDPAMLPPALKRALRVVRDERRPALIDVVIQPR